MTDFRAISGLEEPNRWPGTKYFMTTPPFPPHLLAGVPSIAFRQTGNGEMLGHASGGCSLLVNYPWVGEGVQHSSHSASAVRCKIRVHWGQRVVAWHGLASYLTVATGKCENLLNKKDPQIQEFIHIPQMGLKKSPIIRF